MDLEGQVTELNKHFFFEEFTYSNNKFMPTPKKEVELADNIIWIGKSLIAFQLKERNVGDETTEEKESKWFSKKVLTEASRQIRDTLNYLEENPVITIENHRGHSFGLAFSEIDEIHKIICYMPSKLLPLPERSKKFRISKSAGFIHLFPDYDYQRIVKTLLTPAELCEYLNFRQLILERTTCESPEIAEQSLVGQFLISDFEAEPNNQFYKYSLAIDHKVQEWDVSGLIKKYTDRMTTENHYSEYYKIVGEVAQLKRNELREFKTRFELSMKNCGKDEPTLPYRIAFPRTGCGFVFIPLDNKAVNVRQQGLKNLTLGCKYDLNLNKCIGISFYPDEGGWYFIEWCFIDYQWKYDQDLDELLKDSNPFREVKIANLGRYNCRED